MEAEMIQAVTNSGVLGVCLYFLFRYMKSREEQHDKEAEKWMVTVENNTKIMQAITDKMDTMFMMLRESYNMQAALPKGADSDELK